MYKIVFLFILSTLFFTSCFKEDEQVDPYPRGDASLKTVDMTPLYTFQFYIDLENGEEVAVNNKNDWDLGFQSGEESYLIYLNTSAFMTAGNTGIKDFDAVSDTLGLDWKFDKSDGNPDSTAVGNWVTIDGTDTSYSSLVYVINRGYNDLGNLRGLKKVQFLSVSANSYTFKYANLDGSNAGSFEVQKQDGVYLSGFSFKNGGEQTYFEPQADSWDVVFTQYTTLLYTTEGDPYPYLVTGVLINRQNVEVAMDSLNDFNSIDRSIADEETYSTRLDIIGYDWKELVGDVNTGNVSYNIVPNRVYLIKNRNGFVYKLRFVGFYNNQGDKGYPSFEWQLI